MTDIFNSIRPLFVNLKEYLLYRFDGPDGALQALALAGFVVIILLFIVARRQSLMAKSSPKLKEPVILNDPVNNAQAAENFEPDALEAVAMRRERQKTQDEATSASNADGFVFHRRKAKKADLLAKIDDEDAEIALAAIEQEMLATRQLFLDGVISREVYVEERRILYGKAQRKI